MRSSMQRSLINNSWSPNRETIRQMIGARIKVNTEPRRFESKYFDYESVSLFVRGILILNKFEKLGIAFI